VIASAAGGLRFQNRRLPSLSAAVFAQVFPSRSAPFGGPFPRLDTPMVDSHLMLSVMKTKP